MDANRILLQRPLFAPRAFRLGPHPRLAFRLLGVDQAEDDGSLPRNAILAPTTSRDQMCLFLIRVLRCSRLSWCILSLSSSGTRLILVLLPLALVLPALQNRLEHCSNTARRTRGVQTNYALETKACPLLFRDFFSHEEDRGRGSTDPARAFVALWTVDLFYLVLNVKLQRSENCSIPRYKTGQCAQVLLLVVLR